MAKTQFSKLEIKPNESTCIIYRENSKGQDVGYEVKYTIPYKEQIDLVNRVLNQAVDENGFYNPMRVNLFLVLEITFAYTNLSFTAKQKEDAFKLYDLIVGTGLYKEFISEIDKTQIDDITKEVYTTIDNIYKYKNSVVGLLDTISTDYKNLDLNAQDLKDKIGSENIELLKLIMNKLG